MNTITEIEDAVLALLAEDTSLSAYVKQFSALPSLEEDVLEKLVRKFPAIGIYSPEGEYDYLCNNIQEERGTFVLICVNRNLRGTGAALHGNEDAEEKGLWDMVDDCRQALFPGTLSDVTIVDMKALRRQLLWAGDKYAAASIDIEVTWR